MPQRYRQQGQIILQQQGKIILQQQGKTILQQQGKTILQQQGKTMRGYWILKRKLNYINKYCLLYRLYQGWASNIFWKERSILSILLKRMFHSFLFSIKECSVLFVLYKRMFGSFWFSIEKSVRFFSDTNLFQNERCILFL